MRMAQGATTTAGTTAATKKGMTQNGKMQQRHSATCRRERRFSLAGSRAGPGIIQKSAGKLSPFFSYRLSRLMRRELSPDFKAQLLAAIDELAREDEDSENG